MRWTPACFTRWSPRTALPGVLPDIREKMIDFDLVYVEMDGVRPRVRQWDERRQISGKQASRVKLVLQPAN